MEHPDEHTMEFYDDPHRDFTAEEIEMGAATIEAGEPLKVPGLYETTEDCILASKRFVDLVMARVIT